jgi:hypothetical protein
VSGRYEVAELPPNGRGIVLWGIRDNLNGGEWVENGGEREFFGDRNGALGWVDRQKYLDEAGITSR